MFIPLKMLVLIISIILNLQLTSDLVQDWIVSNPEASICTPEGVHDFKAIANFQDYHGLPEFRDVSGNYHLDQMNHGIYEQVEFD